jgi:uncharacterized protein YjiS (DUF1127 family)
MCDSRVPVHDPPRQRQWTIFDLCLAAAWDLSWLIAAIANELRIRRDIRRLAATDDYLLKDFGLARSEIEYHVRYGRHGWCREAAGRGFSWRVPLDLVHVDTDLVTSPNFGASRRRESVLMPTPSMPLLSGPRCRSRHGKHNESRSWRRDPCDDAYRGIGANIARNAPLPRAEDGESRRVPSDAQPFAAA